MTRELKVTRKADRLKMAIAVEGVAERFGCTIEKREGGLYPGPRCMQLSLQGPGGLCVTVSLDGDTTLKDSFLLSWHMALDSRNELDAATFGGGVNPHHRRKATHLAQGFEDLLARLARGFELAASGKAYVCKTPLALAA